MVSLHICHLSNKLRAGLEHHQKQRLWILYAILLIVSLNSNVYTPRETSHLRSLVMTQLSIVHGRMDILV